jgi:hypothetical protein
MIKGCILSDRLYVPIEHVDLNILDEFVYIADEKDTYDYGAFETVVGSIKTFAKVRMHGELYYAFSRGNLAKIGRLFGHLPWVDQTVAPKLTSGLEFKGKLYNWNDNHIGQQEATDKWLQIKNGIINAPPRFGKTITSIYLLTKVGCKTLIVAHQKDLLEQYYKSFTAFTNVDDIQDIKPSQHKDDATGRVYGYFDDYYNPEVLDVCLLCWQTFASKFGDERIKAFGKTWGMVIVDECHKLGGLCYARVINRLHARHRMGLTGTVERVDGREFLLKDIIGPVVTKGQVRTITCDVEIVHTGIKINYTFSEPLVRLYKRIYKANGRMDIILKYLYQDVQAGRYICFAFHRSSVADLVEWTTKLQNLGFSAEAFYGTCRDRKGVLKRARTGETQILVCNSQMLTGIDVPRWNTYYSAFPTSNVVFTDGDQLSGNFYQEFSRIRTPFTYEDGSVKKCGIIRDFVDHHSFCYSSYRKRYKAYQTQGFNIKVKKLEVKQEKLIL